MRKLVFDIETIECENPHLALAPFIRKLMSTSAKPAKGSGLKGLVESGTKGDAAIGKSTLTPVASRILCIGAYEVQEGENIDKSPDATELFPESNGQGKWYFIYDPDEKVMLTKFAALVRTMSTYITFNGRSYDCPFLMFRAAVHGVPLSLDIYPYNGKSGHLDMYVHMNSVGMLGNIDPSLKWISLKKWLEYFGLGTKLSIADGEISFTKLLEDGNLAGIEDYCKNDVMKTYALYKIFEGNFR